MAALNPTSENEIYLINITTQSINIDKILNKLKTKLQMKCGKAVNLLFPINNTPNLDITLIIEQGFNIQIKTIQEIVDETKEKQIHTLKKINYSQLASIGISNQVVQIAPQIPMQQPILPARLVVPRALGQERNNRIAENLLNRQNYDAQMIIFQAQNQPVNNIIQQRVLQIHQSYEPLPIVPGTNPNQQRIIPFPTVEAYQ
jgi:hypothetical protein